MFLLKNTYFVRFSYDINDKSLYSWQVFSIYFWKSPTENINDIINNLISDNANNINLLKVERL